MAGGLLNELLVQGKILLQDHISHCVADALQTGDQKVLDDLAAAIDQFVK